MKFLSRIIPIAILHTLILQAQLQLKSPAFDNQSPIPEKYTCGKENISPALTWNAAPKNTKSFALIMDDPDAPTKTWVHWILFNIPVTVQSLPENVSSGEYSFGVTDFNNKRIYGGPCPPSGTHHYRFTLYALDCFVDITPEQATKKALLNAISGHIIEQSTLIGTYKASDHS